MSRYEIPPGIIGLAWIRGKYTSAADWKSATTCSIS
jgi:hypothetical protein